MTRLNIVLVILVVACALGLVTSQHEARKRYVAHEKALVQAKELEIQWKQLELEQSALAKASLIDTKARKTLALQPPQGERVIHLTTETAAQAALNPGAPR